MTIESIIPFAHGVYVVTVFQGEPKESTFTTSAEAIAYVAAFNAFCNA